MEALFPRHDQDKDTEDSGLDVNSPELDPNTASLSKCLEHITQLLLEAVNARDRALVQQITNRYFSPNLEVDRSSEPGVSLIHSTTREAYVDNILAYAKKFDLHVRPYNSSAKINEEDGQARVFTTVTSNGTDYASSRVLIESVLVYYFERHDEDDWRCYRIEFIRGPGNSLFGFGYVGDEVVEPPDVFDESTMGDEVTG